MNLFRLGLDLQECLRNNNIHHSHNSESESESDQEPSEELIRRHSYLKPPPFVVDEARLNPNKSPIAPPNLKSPIKSKPGTLKRVESPSHNRYLCLRTNAEESSDDQQAESKDAANLHQDDFIKIGRKGKKLLVEKSTKSKLPIGMENIQNDQRQNLPVGMGNKQSDQKNKLPVGIENIQSAQRQNLSVGMGNIQSDQRKNSPVGMENIQSDQKKLVSCRASDLGLPTKITKPLQTEASTSGLKRTDLQVVQSVSKKATKKKKSQSTLVSDTNSAVLPTDEFIPVVGKSGKKKKKRSKSLVKLAEAAEIPLKNRFSDLKLNATDESDVEKDFTEVDKSHEAQLEFEIQTNEKLALMQKENLESSVRMKSSNRRNAVLFSKTKETSMRQRRASFPHRTRKSYRKERNIREEVYAAMFEEIDSFFYLQDVFDVYLEQTFLGCFSIGECLKKLTACNTRFFLDLTTADNNLDYWYGVRPKEELHRSVLLEDFDIREVAHAKFLIPVERAQLYRYKLGDVLMYKVVDRCSDKVIEQFEISCGYNKGRENCWSYLGVLLRVFTFFVNIICKLNFFVKHVYSFFASK